MAFRFRTSCFRLLVASRSSTNHQRFLRNPPLNRYTSDQCQGPHELPKSNSNNTIKENIYTIPNALTLSRIAACPFLGWCILDGKFATATGLLVYAGVTDWADGYLARRLNMKSVLGTILDPAADKILMTTLTITLATKGLLPSSLAFVIIGRDVLLGISAFYIRYKTLPEPKTFKRYWDFSITSAEVRPTKISKINTALQLGLMGFTTLSPMMVLDLQPMLSLFQLLVGSTTIASGLSYILSTNAVRVVGKGTR